MGGLELCIVGMVLLIALSMLPRLLKALGPLIATIIGVGLAVGVVWLAYNLVRMMIEGAAGLLFGPIGLLVMGLLVAYFGYRQFQKRQYRASDLGDSSGQGVHTWDAKPKRGQPPIEIGDDGEIVTLDELMDENKPDKKKRG